MNAERDGQAAAEQFRTEHRLSVQPLGDLVTIIEQATGFDVAVLDVGPDEHGLTMRDPGRGTVIIGVARTRNPMRQRSSLAHELAHVLFEDWQDIDSQRTGTGTWSERTPVEIRADTFARHLLVPVDGLGILLRDQEAVTLASLSSVVQRFVASPVIAAIAMCQAGYIDAVTKDEWMKWSAPRLATRFGWSDQYRALQAESDQRRAPQRLLARVITGYEEGVLSAQAVATLRGMPLDEVESELKDAGVTPVAPRVAWADAADLPDVDVDLRDLDDDLDAPDVDRQGDDHEQDSTATGDDR